MHKWWFRNAPQVRFVGLRFSITGGADALAAWQILFAGSSRTCLRRCGRWPTGQTRARPQRCHVVPKLSGLHPAILARVTSRPDATIAELRAWLLETHKVSASTGLMNMTLAALDLAFKKNPSTLPSKRVRTLPRHASNGASSSRS